MPAVAIYLYSSSKHRTHIKLLLFEGDGFALYYKRLEQGTYELPVCNSSDSSMNITQQQLQFILQGVSLGKTPVSQTISEKGTGLLTFLRAPT